MYSEKRRSPFKDIQAFENILQELVNSFSESWLTSNSDHPLQILWGRRDMLASIELANLGCSIQKIKNISPDQVRQNIKLLKKPDHGTMAGAVWEIILAATFHNPPNQKSKLLGPRKPTYDIEVETADSFKTLISVKNFGQSKKDQEFIANFNLIETFVVKFINRDIQIIIYRRDDYPSLQAWGSLIRALKMLIESKNNYIHCLIEGWDISIIPLADKQIQKLMDLDTASLYEKENSYTLFISSPFYKNENRNIEFNLNRACSDLIENGSLESNDLQNSLYIHLPEYVSLEDYIDWCTDYFLKNPNAPISFITLFQPTYVTEDENDANSCLAMNHATIMRPNNSKRIHKLTIELPVGRIANKITNSFNNFFETPKHHYRMQSGRIYAYYGDLSQGGKMKARFIHGIKIDAIAKIGIDRKDAIFAINSPPTTQLTLL